MYAVIVATELQGLSDRKGSAMHTCMSQDSAFQTHGAHDNLEGPQSHQASSAADNPLCKIRENKNSMF
jgi:hypothetical protein